MFCQVTDSEEAFIYENRLSIEKSLFSEVSSSNFLRSPVDRCFKKANVFFNFEFADKVNNFWRQFDEEFMWDGWTEVAKVKS